MIFLFLFLISSVFAIGVSPPEFNIDYEGAQTYEATFKLINSGLHTNFVSIDVYGDLADFVSLSQYQFEFKKGQRFQVVTMYIDLPAYENLTVFGKQTVLLYIQEGQVDATGGMAFLTEVTGKVKVDIPVPGKLGEIETFYVESTNEGYGAPVTVVLANKGTENLEDVSLDISIKDFYENELDVITYDNIDIDFDDEYTISEMLPTQSYDSAIYFATARFTYDTEKVPLRAKSKFFVGSTDVSLLNYTPQVIRGKINKISLKLQSLWGSPLKNIRGTLTYPGGSQALPVIDFNEFEQKDLDVYLDIPQTDLENLLGTLTLDIPVDATTNQQKIIPVSFRVVDEVKPSSESPFTTTSILLVSLILVVIILIGVNVYSYVRKKHHDKKY